MKNSFQRDEVIQMLRERQGQGPASRLAQKIGVSEAYLSDIYAGKREPGPAILDFLGLTRKKQVSYEKVS